MTSLSGGSKELQALAAEIEACRRCELHAERLKVVPGAGSAEADVLFIGEGPGAQEDEAGLPFVGRSGQLLDELLQGVGLDRDKVFITNVVKCRPPGNRAPRVDEVRACREYLNRQLQVIRPLLVVTLGRFAMELFVSNGRISEIHGQPRHRDGMVTLPLYHPAAALYRRSLQSVVREDFERIPELLTDLKQRPST